ncbi:MULTISPECIES: transposase [Clostridium]|uniref:Transposase n=1 Tax=Clostridium saudiense TaxID=1414720 RepID=A0ABS2FFF2_9CLOT|nr:MULTISPECIES: transposase [Clostridium]MBM6819061.1 transposase [Clostridium saudiense]
MASPKRPWVSGAIYHITNRGNRQEIIFRENIDYIVYLGILKETLKFYENDNYKLISYCLMSNHVHLLLKTGRKDPSFFMRRVNSMYARYFNSKYQYIGHLFQGRYFSNLINNVIELLEVSRYIHLNPVRAKMVDSPEKYMWSSYNKIVLDKDKFKDLDLNSRKLMLDMCIDENEILDLLNIYSIVEENNKKDLEYKVKNMMKESKIKYKKYVESKVSSEEQL